MNAAPMNKLKLVCRTIVQRVKQACLFPRNVLKQRRWQIALDEREAERLDRIRNPSKYLGQ
jgi:hypothetical protein